MFRRHRINLLFNYQNYVNIISNKHFHLSPLHYLRKPPLSRRTLNPSSEEFQEQSVAGVFYDTPKEVYTNFYGVESDEGVINVEERGNSKKSIKSLQAMSAQMPTNEFRSFNFGAVRLDSENKPSYYTRNHRLKINQKTIKQLNSQEKNMEQFKDPDTVTNLENELDQNKASEKQKVSRFQDLKEDTIDSFISNNNSEVSRVTSSYKQNNLKTSSKVSESFIDKYFFTENVAPHISKSADKDENYKEIKKENLNISDMSPEKLHHNIKKDIDNFKSDNFQSKGPHVIDSHEQNQFDLSKVSESFIDKNYFADNYIENSIPQIEKHSDNFIEEQYFKESCINAPKAEYKTVLGSETNKSANENDIGFNHSLNIQYLPKKDEETYSEISAATGEKNIQQRKNLHKNINKNKISTIKSGLANESEKVSQTENPNKEVNSEGNLNSSENSYKKESSDENNIKTASDFIKNIRKNNLLPDDIKKGISAKKEKKVDSKGFRILKHQVPSLKYFTNDEMLELLKSNVLYTDEDVVVLNKPYNLVIHESNTSKELACLSRYLDDLAKLLDPTINSPKLITVHRIDKETTGCLLLARNEIAAARLKSLFAQRKVHKTYWIVTSKVPDPLEGIIDIPISEGKIESKSRMVLHPKLPDDIHYVNHSKAGKQAITQYSVIAVSGNAALVEVKPETGIKHQIRVHFGFGLGCPILGDHKYSYLDKLVPQKLPSDLLQKLRVRQSKVRHIALHIHSKHIFIPQYSNEKNLFVTAPLPRHMSENLKFLKFKKNR